MEPTSIRELTQELKQRAKSLGFVMAGVTAAATPGRLDAFHRWLDSGMHGSMHYLSSRRDAYSHPNSILDGCKTILMLAIPYVSGDAPEARVSSDVEVICEPVPEEADEYRARGRIARYAQGAADYHDVLHAKLKQLKSWLENRMPDNRARGIVDTAPLNEREFAAQAGLGWIGKNTLLLNRDWGSYFFLAALLTDLELTVDAPSQQPHCGTCVACLNACPTQAFPEPFVLDARKCLSYLNIETRGDLSASEKSQFSDWLFGCDICQEVCPWNRKERPHDSAFAPIHSRLQLADILALDETSFRQRFRKTPFWRPRRAGFIRNAILLTGTQKCTELLPALESLLDDSDDTVRAAAEWAIAKIRGDN